MTRNPPTSKPASAPTARTFITRRESEKNFACPATTRSATAKTTNQRKYSCGRTSARGTPPRHPPHGPRRLLAFGRLHRSNPDSVEYREAQAEWQRRIRKVKERKPNQLCRGNPRMSWQIWRGRLDPAGIRGFGTIKWPNTPGNALQMLARQKYSREDSEVHGVQPSRLRL